MKAYNHYRQYHRNEAKREAREIVSNDTDLGGVDDCETERATPADASYESYCAALGVDVRAARSASPIAALAAFVARDPIGDSMSRSGR